MQTTYISGANNTGATGGQALGSDTQADVEIFKIIVGVPVSSGNIWVYGMTNPGSSSNTTNLAAKFTMGSSIATSQVPLVLDLTDGAGHGLRLNQGGNIMIDQTMQLTVMWELVDNSQA